ncbi:helix-turn-helix transcriptional regulator [Kitasatospora sp. NPDC094028]
MKESSARLLRLLTLLQSHREWSGQDLADRLGVSTRTVRRDVDKLRALDYPVNAVKGIDGGYRLGAGAQLPPLLLDDEEAVAVAVADRISPRTPTGPRFTPRALPDGDAAAHVARGVAQMWPYRATIRLHAPAHSATAREAATYGTIEAVDEQSCLLHAGADSPRALTFLLGALDVDFRIEDAPELAEILQRIAGRYRRATSEPET